MIVLGYDPGGEKKSGVALLGETRAAATTCTGVAAWLSWVREQLDGRQLDAAGIDAPLSWSIEGAGLRPMDRWLQDRHPAMKGSVLSTNSLYGSAAVQGPAMAMSLRLDWPDVKVNETHPKVLYFCFEGRRYRIGPDLESWCSRRAGLRVGIRNEHEADALLSAIVTRDALKDSRAYLDLMSLDGVVELLRPAGTVFYYWPQRELTGGCC